MPQAGEKGLPAHGGLDDGGFGGRARRRAQGARAPRRLRLLRFVTEPRSLDEIAADLRDYDPFVSHRHAELRRAKAGFELVDALSSNGIYVDWARVPRGASVQIENGTLLRAGKSLILFRTT